MLTAFVRHGSNAVPIVVALGLAVAFAPLGAVIGAPVFFVSEYATRRFMLHAPPATRAWI